MRKWFRKEFHAQRIKICSLRGEKNKQKAMHHHRNEKEQVKTCFIGDSSNKILSNWG